MYLSHELTSHLELLVWYLLGCYLIEEQLCEPIEVSLFKEI